MKKFLFAVFPLFYFIISCLLPFGCPLSSLTAHAAADTYACILSDAYFYTAESETSGLFLLPKTYYVKVLSSSYPYSKVEYLTDGASTRKLVGYCKTSDLTFVDYIPQTPYLYHFFKMTYTANGSEDSGDGFLSSITVSCTYYGDYLVGSKTYAYVLQEDGFGYVPKPADLSYTENAEYAERNAQKDGDEPKEETENGTNPAQIAILVVLCLLAPILAGIILRSSKSKTYDFENEDQ